MLLQIELMLSEIDLLRTEEEEEDADPIEFLQGNLIGILDPAEPAKWHAALSIFILDRIEGMDLRNDQRLVEIALRSLNLSKIYSEQAEQYSKAEKQRERNQRSETAVKANELRHEAGEKLKQAALEEYEMAVRIIQERNYSSRNKTTITYRNIAKVVYPKIEHLNKDGIGRKVIGRNGKPEEALAEIFEDAVADGKLKSTMHYRKKGSS